MKVLMRPVASLRPSPENPRVIDDAAVDAVARSIETYGFLVPILLDGDEVVCGHARLLAADRLQMRDVPCVDVDGMSPEQVREFRLVENRVAESAGEWDVPKLNALLEDLPGLQEWTDVDLGVDLVDEALAGEAEEPPEPHPEPSAEEAGPVVVLVRRSRYTATSRFLEEALGKAAG